MKASSVGWELYIQLSADEISRLLTEKLEGKIRVHDNDAFLGEFPFSLFVQSIRREQLYVELKTKPSHVYVDKVQEYFIYLSPDGYQQLRERGRTGDRMYLNAGCKVFIILDEKSKYL